MEWLHLLRLEEYYETLCEQGYDSVDKVTELTWEDLEEIGIQKLGTKFDFFSFNEAFMYCVCLFLNNYALIIKD